ncbi:TetR/AcrR family transcriptional regulator [Halomonas denitrificans]|nr:TetR/AcrR family transcriptional regulator [Halomonas denitrificans]
MGKKQQILQAAIELFATEGYEKTSISAICDHAKASKGAVFHHFKNKDELLRAVFVRMAEIINEVGDSVSAGNEGLSAPERLACLLEQIFESMSDPEQKRYYQFDFQVMSQPAMRSALQDLIDQRYQLMMDSFQPILQEIPSADSVVDAHMLIAEIDGIAMNYLFAEGDYPLKEIQQRFIRKYRVLLGA